jgi:hypothetical protein
MAKPQASWNKRFRSSYRQLLLATAVTILGATVSSGSLFAQPQFSGSQGGGSGTGFGGGGNPSQEVVDLASGAGGWPTSSSAAESGSSQATNREAAVATLDCATDVAPSSVTVNGPTREARVVLNPNGAPDGGVHDLFVITGRSDAPGIAQQRGFAAELAQDNMFLRIPTPVFADGPRRRFEVLFNEIVA